MTDPQKTATGSAEETGPGDAGTTGQNPWNSLGDEFQALGQSIAVSIKEAWHDEKNQQHLEGLQHGLQNMANRVSKAVDETVNSPKTDEVKTEVKKASGELKDLGGKVYTDSRPHLIKALKTMEEGLQSLIGRLEKEPPPAEDAAPYENPPKTS